jgi:transcriptional regulator with XRE-family HTH domain
MTRNQQLARAFGDRLRELRGDATFRDFAERIGIDPSERNGYEINRKLPSLLIKADSDLPENPQLCRLAAVWRRQPSLAESF